LFIISYLRRGIKTALEEAIACLLLNIRKTPLTADPSVKHQTALTSEQLLNALAVSAVRDDARDGDTFVLAGLLAVTLVATAAEERALAINLAVRPDPSSLAGRVFALLDSAPDAALSAALQQQADRGQLALLAFPRTPHEPPFPLFGLHLLVADVDGEGIRLTHATDSPASPLWVAVNPEALSAPPAPSVSGQPEVLPRDAWIHAARAYLAAGLPAAARVAMERASEVDHPLRRHAIRQLHVDHALSEALAAGDYPLLPVVGHGGTSDLAMIPAPSAGDGSARFAQALEDEMISGAVQPILRAFVLRSVIAGVTFLDLAPGDGHLAVAVALAGTIAPLPVLVERAEWRRQALTGMSTNASARRPDVCQTLADAMALVRQRALQPGVLIHADRKAITDGTLARAVLMVREAGLHFVVVVSETDAAVFSGHETVHRFVPLASLLQLQVGSVAFVNGQFITTTLSQLPRPHLLIAC
jgi:hypothetical protein